MRCKPGSRFWAFFYLAVDFGGMWPAWAATAATAIAAAWFGRMPGDVDAPMVRLFAYATFGLCVAIVLFGRKIYDALEKAQFVMVAVILAYLAFVDLFMVPPRIW